MKQIDFNAYEVAKGENITMIFTPTNVGPSQISVTIDEGIITASPGPKPTFHFKAKKEPGDTHFGMIEGTFVVANGRFDLIVKGDDGKEFPGPSVSNSTPSSDIEFRVV